MNFRRQEILSINQGQKEGFPAPPVFHSREDLTSNVSRSSTPNSSRPSKRPPPAPMTKPVIPVDPPSYAQATQKSASSPPSKNFKPVAKPPMPPVPNFKPKPPPPPKR